MGYPSLRIFVASSLFLGAVGCSVTPEKPRGRRPSDRSAREIPLAASAEPMPWEIWQPFYDQHGARLTNSSLLLGDEYLRKGKRRSALEAYLQANKTKLSAAEAEAAALRVASQYLALDESGRALSTISSYFKNRGLAEDSVDTSFSLLLAYAYGRHGDSEQALAWFSKANRQAQQGERSGLLASETGASLYLRTIPQENFEAVALDWSSDPFISEAMGKERMRRAAAGTVEKADVRYPFWENYSEKLRTASSLTDSGVASGPAPVVGVLLSLSDRFGSLGRDTKQGLELAIAGDPVSPKIKLEVRDVGVDSALATSSVRELATASKPSVIVGPLLTEVAVSAADAAREMRMPLISLSKSESFRTGDGVSRVGATTTSQVDALVTTAADDYKITRYAILYPETAAGQEFVQIFKKRLASRGLFLVLDAPYAASDEASLFEAVQRLEASDAQAVLIPDSIDSSAKLLSNLSPSARKRIRPLGTALWDNPSKIANSQALFEGAVFVSPFFPQSLRPVVKQFSESYRSRYKTAPNFLAAQGFDVGTLVVNAVRRATRDNTSFNEALSKLPQYEGVTGVIVVRPPADIERSFYVVEVTPAGFQERFPGSLAQQQPAGEGADLTSDSSAFINPDEKVESGY
jgi:branched-chain amino acid transport system substrate-binding protein